MNDPAVIDVLVKQREGWKMEPRLNRALGDIRFLPLRQPQYKNFLRENGPFLYCDNCADESVSPVLIVPDYAADPGRIIVLRFFPISSEDSPLNRRAKQLIDWFAEHRDEGFPLDHFPHRHSIA